MVWNHFKITGAYKSRGGTRYILGWGGAARPLIPWVAYFPTLFKTEFRFLIPCLRDLTRNQKKFCCSLVRRTYAEAVYRPRKYTLFKPKIDKIDTLIKTKNDKIDALFKTKIPKNIPWLGARPDYALIREYPPGYRSISERNLQSSLCLFLAIKNVRKAIVSHN